jgi:hypothetical protein
MHSVRAIPVDEHILNAAKDAALSKHATQYPHPSGVTSKHFPQIFCSDTIEYVGVVVRSAADTQGMESDAIEFTAGKRRRCQTIGRDLSYRR